MGISSGDEEPYMMYITGLVSQLGAFSSEIRSGINSRGAGVGSGDETTPRGCEDPPRCGLAYKDRLQQRKLESHLHM